MTSVLIDLETARTLTAIAHRGSVGAAAAHLGLSQQAVSARIRTAEQRLGRSLLLRTRTGSTLTVDGQLITEWATPLLAAEAAFTASIETLSNDRRSSITIAASQSISEAFMPRWIAAHRTRDPHTTVRLNSGNSTWVIEQIRTGHATLGLIETPTIPDDLPSTRIGTDPVAVITDPDHPWASRQHPIALDDLASTPLVLRETGSGTRATLETALARQQLALHEPAAELSSTGAIRTATATGLGPSIISRALVTDELTTGRLTEIPLTPPLHRPLTALWNGPLPTEARTFLEAIANPAADA